MRRRHSATIGGTGARCHPEIAPEKNLRAMDACGSRRFRMFQDIPVATLWPAYTLPPRRQC
jgi:hypothetical protein